MQNYMTYKSNCKINNEVAVKLAIVKQKVEWISIKKIIKNFGCSRNIPNLLFKKFRNSYWDAEIKRLKLIKKIDNIILEKYKEMANNSTKPKFHKTWLDYEVEKEIISIQKKHKYGRKRLYTHIKRKFKWDENSVIQVKDITFSLIKGIFKRNNLKVKRIRTANWNNRQELYPYDRLECFEQLNYDVKIISDLTALPKDIYDNIKHNKDIPINEFNIIDVKTRTRFTAYGYEKSASNGLNFLIYTISRLRSLWVKTHIKIQSDNGAEFWLGTDANKKLRNKYMNALDAEFDTIPLWAKHLQNVIERSHRSDDEEFLCPRGHLFTSKEAFIKECYGWNYYRNIERVHHWIKMGCTPLEKLEKAKIINAQKIAEFPVMILEDFFHPLLGIKQTFDYIFEQEKNILNKNAQNVLTYYQVKRVILCWTINFLQSSL